MPVDRLGEGRSARRILILSTCPDPWGGSEELWFGAACALREQGHEVRVLKTTVAPDHPKIRALHEQGVVVRELSRPAWQRRWALASLLLPPRFVLDTERRAILVAARRLLLRRPDLVVVAQGANTDGVHLAELCRRLRVPYVIVSQKASELLWPSDAVGGYLSRVFGRARLTVFVSAHNRDLTEDQIGLALPAAVVLPNPVRTVGDGPLPWPAPEPGDDELRLACVGRLFIAEKGQDLLIRALAGERWRRRRLSVTFFGEGMHREALARLAERLGVEQVRFAGHVADLEALWADHHALVLPSRSEGSPLALMEAMRCGRPAIVTDVGGNVELVDEGRTGFIAASPSVSAVDDALERAWQRRADWPALGQAAAESIRALEARDPAGELAAHLLAVVGGRRR